MRYAFTFWLLLLVSVASAQTRKDSLSRFETEIMNVARSTYSTYNHDAFFPLVSPAMVLVLVDPGIVADRNGYERILRRIGDGHQKRNIARSIDFRYNRLVFNGDIAYAEGIFKVELKSPDGSSTQQYSRFSHVFRWEAGGWKLTLDSHTTRPGLTEVEFQQAKSLKDLQEAS